VYVCPNRNCSEIIVTSTFYEGYLVKCKNCNCEFSQINCSKCLRGIVFNSNLLMDSQGYHQSLEDKLQSSQKCESSISNSPHMSPQKNTKSDSMRLIRYVEGQIIECPYEDCQNRFSHIVCYSCFNSNKFDEEKITNGEKITCQNEKCKKPICKVFCIFCCRMLWYKESVFAEGRKILCPYTDCNKSFYSVKCSKCERYNCWDENQYHCGQPAKCIYKNCNFEFQKSSCALCGIRNDHSNSDNLKNSPQKVKFKFGKNNKCLACPGEFTYNICLCSNSMMVKVHYSEAQGIKCLNNKCKRDIHNAYCPHCDQIIILLRSSYKFGMTIMCPYKECQKKFNYLYCRGCGQGIYYKDNDYQEGQIIKCSKCPESFVMLNCGVCGRGVQYAPNSTLFKKELTCLYPDCKSSYYISNIQKKVYHPYSWEFNTNGKFLIYLKPEKYLSKKKENNNFKNNF
jgi:hypothetical protein